MNKKLINIKESTSGLHSQNSKGKNLEKNNSAVISIIKAGQSKNSRIYTENAIKNIPNLLTHKHKMYLDHNDENARSIKDWVATIDSSWYDETQKAVMANIIVHDEWLMKRIEEAPNEIGISIDALGIIEELDGVFYVEEIEEINSIDFVTEAAAGGGIYKKEIREMIEKFNIDSKNKERIVSIVENISKTLEKEKDEQIKENDTNHLIDKSLLSFNHLNEKNKLELKKYILFSIKNKEDENFDNNNNYEELIRLAINEIIEIAKKLNSSLDDDSNKNYDSKQNDSMLSNFDKAKINSIGLDSEKQEIREMYIKSCKTI